MSAENTGDRRVGARNVATIVLARVLDDAAFATATLDAEVRRHRLSAIDAALATEIVFGTLRAFFALDPLLGSLLTRKAPTSEALEPVVRAALLGGIFQLAAHRTPAFAVTSETVNVVRDLRGAKLAGLTNAILRTVLRTRKHENAPWLGTQTLPSWLATECQHALDETRRAAFLSASDAPPTAIRVYNKKRADVRTELSSALSGLARAELNEGPLDQSLLLARAGNLRETEAYRAGLFAVQDLGAQLLAEIFATAMRTLPNDSPQILDACAGHGGKSLALLDALPKANVWLTDVHPKKRESFARERLRLGFAENRTRYELQDFSVGVGNLPATFSGVFIDAPCTGIGTLERRPEIALRLAADDPKRMAELQLQIVHNVKTLVAPGGLLAFAVCSIARAEIDGIPRELENDFVRFPHEIAVGNAMLRPDDDGVFRIGPWLGPGFADAYQMSLWQRKA